MLGMVQRIIVMIGCTNLRDFLVGAGSLFFQYIFPFFMY